MNGIAKALIEKYGISAVALLLAGFALWSSGDRYTGVLANEKNKVFQEKIHSMDIQIARLEERVDIAVLEGKIQVLQTIVNNIKVPPILFKERVDDLAEEVNKLRDGQLRGKEK